MMVSNGVSFFEGLIFMFHVKKSGMHTPKWFLHVSSFMSNWMAKFWIQQEQVVGSGGRFAATLPLLRVTSQLSIGHLVMKLVTLGLFLLGGWAKLAKYLNHGLNPQSSDINHGSSTKVQLLICPASSESKDAAESWSVVLHGFQGPNTIVKLVRIQKY